MKDLLLNCPLGEGKDVPIWNLSSKRVLQLRVSFKHLWKARVPPKIKIWLWLIWHNAIATKNNMQKRVWTGNTKCRFCEEEEDIHHLFFLCPAPKYMWSVVSIVLGARDRPGNLMEYFCWISKFPGFTVHTSCWCCNFVLGTMET
jgi:hypothetical protein